VRARTHTRRTHIYTHTRTLCVYVFACVRMWCVSPSSHKTTIENRQFDSAISIDRSCIVSSGENTNSARAREMKYSSANRPLRCWIHWIWIRAWLEMTIVVISRWFSIVCASRNFSWNKSCKIRFARCLGSVGQRISRKDLVNICCNAMSATSLRTLAWINWPSIYITAHVKWSTWVLTCRWVTMQIVFVSDHRLSPFPLPPAHLEELSPLCK